MSILFQLPSSDAALVRRALDDDPRALEALVVRHSPKVHAVVRALGVPMSSVEDATQDAFLHAVRDLRQLRDPERFGPWLVGIARNAARQWLRKRTPFAGVEHSEPEGSSPEPAEDLETRDLREHVHRRVLELPEEIREAVFVYYYEGRSTRAAARALGISTAALWHRLERARDLLRQRLWRLFGESLEGSMPSRAAWRVKGRGLSLVLLAAVPLSMRSSIAVAAPASLAPQITGGLILSGKKLMISAAIAACMVAGGIAWIVNSEGSSRGGPELASVDASGEAAAAARSLKASEKTSTVQRELDATSRGSGVATVDGEGPPAFTGRVISTEGAPIAGATIKIVAADVWRGAVQRGRPGENQLPGAKRVDALRAQLMAQLKLAASALSASDGRFAFSGGRDGEFLLFASHEGHLPRSSAILARRGSTTEIELQLSPGASLEGVVTDAAGAPVPEVEIRVERADLAAGRSRGGVESILESLEQGSIPIEALAFRTGLDGRFRFSTLEPVEHDLRARKTGYVEERVRGAVPGSEPIRVVLDAGASAKGRVILVGTGPLAKARVWFEPLADREVHRVFSSDPSSGGDDLSPAVETHTDTDGRFVISGLVEGKNRFAVEASSLPRTERELELKPGVTDLGDISVEPAASIAGIVRLPGGAPAPGVRVTALAPARDVRSSNWVAMKERDSIDETVTDAQGRFALSHLTPGEHDVSAQLAGFAPTLASAVTAGSTGIELVLRDGVEIRGRVLDAATSAPISGVSVEPSARASLGVESNERGEFRLTGIPAELLSRSTLWVNFKHPEYDAWHGRGMPLWNGGEPPTIRLTRKEIVSGVVLAPDGGPVADARITIDVHGLPEEARGYNPAAGIQSFSSADGTFAVDAPVGLRSMMGSPRYSLRASHPRLGGARGAPSDVPPPGAEWPTQRLMLASCRVEGTVRGDGAAVIAGAWVRLSTGVDARTAMTRKDGTFVLDGLAPGLTEATVRAAGYAPWRAAGVEVSNGTARLDVDLDRGGSISGRVVDESGAGLGDVEVVADLPPRKEKKEDPGSFEERMRRLELSGIAATRTNEQGEFRFERLPDEELRIVARRSGYEAAETRARAGATTDDIVLGRFAAISGQVTDAATRRPITRFDVDIIDLEKLAKQGKSFSHDYRVGSEGELTIEDPAGRFVYDGLRSGRFEVIVRARGWLPLRRETEARAGELIPLDIELERGGRIEGVALDAETGQPIIGAEVSAMRATRGPFGPADWITTISGTDGRFALEGLADGEYRPSAVHQFYLPASAGSPVRLPAERVPVIELRLEPAGRLEGRLVARERGARVPKEPGPKESGGEPVSRAQRSLHLESITAGEGDAKSHGPQFVHLDPGGAYEAENLKPGRYRLVLSSQDMAEPVMVHLGPNGGVSTSKPVGPEKALWSGEVEIEARRTTVQDVSYTTGE